MNSWGNRFRVTLWGESHGAQVGVTIDGVPAGIARAESDFEADLARRRAGAAGTALPQDCPAAIAGHALAGRILGERIPLTCF